MGELFFSFSLGLHPTRWISKDNLEETAIFWGGGFNPICLVLQACNYRICTVQPLKFSTSDHKLREVHGDCRNFAFSSSCRFLFTVSPLPTTQATRGRQHRNGKRRQINLVEFFNAIRNLTDWSKEVLYHQTPRQSRNEFVRGREGRKVVCLYCLSISLSAWTLLTQSYRV